MSFLNGQDRTPNIARQVLPDGTESGLNILPYKYTKTEREKNIFGIFFSIFKSPASGKENIQVRFPDSPDFENLPDFQTGRDVW